MGQSDKQVFANGALESKVGGSRQDLLLNVPIDWSRDEAMAPSALKLVASGADSRVSSKIDVLSVGLAWGDEWLITEHEPQISHMRVWPIPGRHWENDTAAAEPVEFEGFTITPIGLRGWEIYNARGVLADVKTFPDVFAAKSHVVNHLRSKQVG